MKIIGLILLAVGALLSFGANFTVSHLKKREATQKEVLNTKLWGLLLAAIGFVLVMLG